ncbi:MAG: hypothetical protein ACE5QV_05875, partial [Fidelibacterota bacterium]
AFFAFRDPSRNRAIILTLIFVEILAAITAIINVILGIEPPVPAILGTAVPSLIFASLLFVFFPEGLKF